MRKLVLLLLSTLMISLLLGFQALSGSAAEKQGTLVVVSATGAASLDPAHNYYSYGRLRQRLAYEPLVEISEDLKPVPALAKSWEVSEDHKTYTFYLRRGVTFTDGTSFTAEAVKYNLNRVIGLGLSTSSMFKNLEPLKVEVVDDYTVRIKLPFPHVGFVHTMSWLLMVSPTAAKKHEKDGDWGHEWLNSHMVGTGPYILEKWEPDNVLIATKNNNYWRGEPPFDRIVVRVIPEELTRKQMLLKGEADYVFKITRPSVITELKATEGITVRGRLGTLITIPMKIRGPFKDKKVRKAFTYAFDYEAFWKNVMKGTGKTVRSPIIPRAFGYDKGLPLYHKDLEKAKQLLTEAGYPNGFEEPVQLDIISAYQSWYPQMAAILQRNLADLGITLKIKDIASVSTYLSRVLNKDVNKGPDLYAWLRGFLGRYSFFDLLSHYSSQAIPANNGSHYRNPTFDKLLKEAYKTPSKNKVRELFEKMQRALVDNPPAIFVGAKYYYIAYKSNLKGIHRSLFDRAGNPYFWHFE